jgi:Cu(I)/Ag(I) efflux system membrane fusion protein
MLILMFTGSVAAAQDHSGHTAPPTAEGQAGHGTPRPAATEQHPAGHEAAPAPSQEEKKRAKQPKAKKKKAEENQPVTITLPEEKRQLIGVRTAVAAYRSLDRQVRTVGKVDVDETRLAFVNTKVAGWVRKLYIDYTGQKVVKGQPLLSIYSPDLVTAQEEYLLALRSQGAAAAPGGFSEVAASQQSLIESARRRLLLWDITPEQIAELEKNGKPQTEMVIQAPLDGIVLEKMVLEGTYVMPGMNLYKIADLSNVWIIADVYEYEAPLVTVGQEARVSLAYEPGESFTAAVIYISPVLDPTTRTIKVRLAAKNPHLKLKPEMFANVDIKASSGARLAIPAEAVLDSGLRRIVYVEKQPGVYEMREVKLGVRGETYVEVLSGIRKGERVVSSGNFLIDSESQLRAGPGGGGHQH